MSSLAAIPFYFRRCRSFGSLVAVFFRLFVNVTGGVPLIAFLTGITCELASFVFTLSFMLSAKQEAVNFNFLKHFGGGRYTNDPTPRVVQYLILKQIFSIIMIQYNQCFRVFFQQVLITVCVDFTYFVFKN